MTITGCKQNYTIMEQKRSKIAFPFKKIEKLIELANKHGLEFLEVDGIRIVPRRVVPVPAGTSEYSDTKSMPVEKWNQLNQRQKEDYILFGPRGIEEEEQ